VFKRVRHHFVADVQRFQEKLFADLSSHAIVDDRKLIVLRFTFTAVSLSAAN